MKILLSVFLLVSYSSFATSQQEEFKGNWRGTFRLKDGIVVTHEPDRVAFGKSFAPTAIGIEGTEDGKEILLKTNSTKEEFIAALVKSGLYNKE